MLCLASEMHCPSQDYCPTRVCCRTAVHCPTEVHCRSKVPWLRVLHYPNEVHCRLDRPECSFLQESEYAAWTLVNGYSLNHAAVSVHRLKELE